MTNQQPPHHATHPHQYEIGHAPMPHPHPHPPGSGRRPGAGLGPGQKAAAYLGAGLATFVLLCCGGTMVASLVAPDPEPSESVATISGRDADGDKSAQLATIAPTSSAAASPTPSASASPSASPTAAPSPRPSTAAPAPTVRQPKIETRTVTETRQIPFQEKRVNDPNLAKGQTKVKTAGVAGVKTLTYEVTYTDGVQTAKRLVGEKVTRQPVTKVVLVGTKVAQQCHPSYTGACVPIASDVDCAGGSGNGPAYVQGPVTVVGPDDYGLDHDNDGIGCE
ncbi:G5 domain-containing protein [Solwaraspora sp. WMMB335]|uniref:G5 domain-containing protein n=1 Tax=Solwaraspora sp. WMMB335 TaxID=3404118 RepID=UPI003B9489C0